MATRLTRNVSRVVQDEHGRPVTVTLTAEGVVFRRPRSRSTYVLPYAAGEVRAQVLAAKALATARPVARGSAKRRRTSRNLL